MTSRRAIVLVVLSLGAFLAGLAGLLAKADWR